MNKDKFISWMTGFYEGEGSVSNDISNNNRLRVSVTQNDPTPLKIAQKYWGGTIRKRVRKSPASSKICIGYEWRLSHNDSIVFLSDIKEFMIIPYKISQIETALKKCKNGLQRRFKCKYCYKDYASPSGRRRHEKNTHN